MKATYGHKNDRQFFFTVKERFHHGLIIYDILILIGKKKVKIIDSMCIRAVHSSGVKDGAHKYIVTGVQKNSGPKAVRFQQRALTGKVKPMAITKKQRSEQ